MVTIADILLRPLELSIYLYDWELYRLHYLLIYLSLTMYTFLTESQKKVKQSSRAFTTLLHSRFITNFEILYVWIDLLDCVPEL